MKEIKNLLFIFACVLLNISVATSQELASAGISVSEQLGNSSLVILYASNSSLKLEDDLSKPLDSDFEMNSKKEKAEAYDSAAKKEFGSYVNPHTNYLKVVSKDEIVYTKAQLTDKSTGKKIFKEDIKENNAIDLTDVPSGTYILILTDGRKNIYSEELTVY